MRVADRLRWMTGTPMSLKRRRRIIILADNLFGVDLSKQAVEISQLALWIRSARRGKTLADLSRNIVQGNSLVTGPGMHPNGFRLANAFPSVFEKANGGFDCVIGNPPWERLKLQEREFFAFSAPRIANAVSAARRRELIANCKPIKPRPVRPLRRGEGTGRPDTSLYPHQRGFPADGPRGHQYLHALCRVGPQSGRTSGRVGLLVPSGIATDNTTRVFFNELMASKSLINLYDFENKAPVFPDVDGPSSSA